MLNLFVRSLKVRKRLITTAVLLTALFSVGCDEVKDNVKQALLKSGWLHIDGDNGALNYDLTKGVDGAQLITVNSKLYAVWPEAGAPVARIGGGTWGVEPPRVAVYNGDPLSPSWKFVDNGTGIYRNLNKGTPSNGNPMNSAIAFNNKLYVATGERSPDSNNAINLRVAVYNNDDNAPTWSWVDGNGAYGINKNNAQDAYAPQFAVLGSKLYITWLESNASNVRQVRVAVYNGNDSSPSWTLVDGNSATAGLNINSSVSALVTNPIVFNSKLYIYWSENTPNYPNPYGAGTVNGAAQARIAVYNGDDNNPTWSFVDGANPALGLNNNDPYKIVVTESAAVINNKLYVSVTQLRSSDNLWVSRLLVYNGDDNNPTWTQLLDTGSLADARYNHMTVYNSKIYSTWWDNEQIRVIAYNGNDSNPKWEYADGGKGTGINLDPAKSTSVKGLAVFNSQLYCSYKDMGNNEGVRNHVAVKIK